MAHSARSWKIHALALASFAALYLLVLWDIWTTPANGLDLRGFVSGVLLMALLGYAGVSSFLMVWVGRRTWGPVVMHTLALVGLAIAWSVDKQASDRYAAQRAEIEAAETDVRANH